jgi:hypothetical protein
MNREVNNLTGTVVKRTGSEIFFVSTGSSAGDPVAELNHTALQDVQPQVFGKAHSSVSMNRCSFLCPAFAALRTGRLEIPIPIAIGSIGTAAESKNHCHFLCLEAKKVTKENSRQNELLRSFCQAHAQVTLLLVWSCQYD